MPSRRVAIGHALNWILNGWYLFKRSPLVWIGVSVTLVIIWFVLLRIVKLGPLLFNLLLPVFFAGVMLGCRALEQGKALEFGHLFAGFRDNAAALVSVGGVNLIGMLIILQLVDLPERLPQVPVDPSSKEIVALQTELKKMTGPLLAATALYVPLMMLTWFAPLLIVFRKMRPIAALSASFAACLQNIGALTLYAMILLLVTFVATSLQFVGLALALPIIFGSIYASYVDIFERPANDAPSSA